MSSRQDRIRSGVSGTLHVVPTPIGNLADITLRAVECLAAVDLIAAEDTRHARTLLQAHGITAKLVSYHDHNEERKLERLIERLLSGDDVALVSDAGTPLINDPGHGLVVAALARGIEVSVLPGPSAVITALVGSGLPASQFTFAGFPPRRPSSRRAFLAGFAAGAPTLVFFESPHRLAACLADMVAVLGADRPAALGRSLTKSDEATYRGTLAELAAEIGELEVVRGQYTIVVAGVRPEVDPADDAGAEQSARRLAEAMVAAGIDSRRVRSVVQDITGLARNQVYELVRQASVDD